MKQNISVGYKVIFAILVTTAILIRIGIFKGIFYIDTFLSFTVLSNLFALIITLITLKKTHALKTPMRLTLSHLRVLAMVLLLIVLLVYHFLLLPQKILANPDYQLFTFSNIILHYLAPLALFLDWLIFDPKGNIDKWNPLKIVILPLGYFLLATIYGIVGPVMPHRGTSYAYFFMDFGQLGILGVLKWCLPLLLSFLVIAYGIYFIDHILAKKQTKKEH